MFQRTLGSTIRKIAQTFPVLLVTGPRQVGKTTLLNMCANQQTSKDRRYITLDDFDARSMATNDPHLFLQTNPPPIIIDEIQYAPELLSAIKIWVDTHQEPGAFWITGSQKFELMQGIQESLAGRVAIIDLLGLSMAELQERASETTPFLPTDRWIGQTDDNTPAPMSPQAIYQLIWQGMFPKIHVQPSPDRDLFYRSYLQTYIQRDVKDLINVNNTALFNDFLVAAAARTGQLLNYAELARDIGVDNKTVKSWLQVLEVSGLIYLLRPYHRNITKRIIKTPKLYFLDTGLCTYLTKWPTPESLAASSMSGAILETFLFAEILKSYWHQGKEPYFYFYRDTNQKEIDLLIETADTLYPIEFKKTGTPSKKASKSFSIIEKLDKKVGHGCVICFVSKPTPLSQKVTALPVGDI